MLERSNSSIQLTPSRRWPILFQDHSLPYPNHHCLSSVVSLIYFQDLLTSLVFQLTFCFVSSFPSPIWTCLTLCAWKAHVALTVQLTRLKNRIQRILVRPF